MQAIILAAGRGTRMGDTPDSAPKPMLRLRHKPILDYKIRYLPDNIDEVVLVVGHKRSVIQKYFGNSFGGRRITYVVQEELNGSAGALRAARSVLRDSFLVLMGDDLYLKTDLEQMTRHTLAIMGMKINTPVRFAVIDVNEHGTFVSVREKSEAHAGSIINTGAYMISRNFFDYEMISVGNGEYGLPQTLATMTHDHEIALVFATRWRSITTPDDMAHAETLVPVFYPEG